MPTTVDIPGNEVPKRVTLDPGDQELSLRQTSWLVQGKITTAAGVVARTRRAAVAAAAR